MKIRITSFLFAALLAPAIPADSRAQSTAFTYQGRLNQNGAPATGLCNRSCALHGPARAGRKVPLHWATVPASFSGFIRLY